MKNVQDIILNLETMLLTKDVRQSSEKISEILSKGFFEFCSSGKIYQYQDGDVFSSKSFEKNWKISDFQIIKLADECYLATYKLAKNNSVNQYTLRSSIWKFIDGKWKMYFHQGTSSNNI